MKQVELVRPKSYAYQHTDFGLCLNVRIDTTSPMISLEFRNIHLDSGILAKWDSKGCHVRNRTTDKYFTRNDFSFYDHTTGVLNPLFVVPHSGNGISGRVDICLSRGSEFNRVCTYVFSCPLNDSYNISELEDVECVKNRCLGIEFEQGYTFGNKIGTASLLLILA